MIPIFADAIDVPVVLFFGVIVLVPLIAFEVFIEALVLKRIWHLPYGELCTFTFFVNVWSLLAGIPTKILNAFLYAHLLPDDIPGFFARYPFAVAIGSLVYFVVTLLVEGAYAFRWQRRKELGLARTQIWRGVLLANAATYVVLAPLHYYATRPGCEIREFFKDTRWTSQPTVKVIFTDATNHYLKSARLDGSAGETIVPMPTTDYLVSTNLDVCLFRGTNGNLYLYRHDRDTSNLIWKTDERFLMNQVAFSPSGERVAYASEKDNSIDVVEVLTGKRIHLPLAPKFNSNGPFVAWSPEEAKFFVRGFDKALRLVATLPPEGDPVVDSLDGTNTPSLLTCYGRTGDARWWSGEDWGVSYSQDTCANMTATAGPGLDSGLRIRLKDQKSRDAFLTVSVRPGLLHLARLYFDDVAFLQEGCECLFESNGYIYLLNVNEKRLGTFVKGHRFVLLTTRYQKPL